MSNGKTPQDKDEVLSAEGHTDADTPQDKTWWLTLARANFSAAVDYQNAALINQWERNADHFNNRHYRRSAYNTMLYKGRSTLFRPLTRASERSSSAQTALALFSNIDLVDVTARNESDKEAVLAAKTAKNILHFRLGQTIKWYLTVMGAWQDTRVYGPCVTYTGWDYQEVAEVLDVEGVATTVTKVLKDEPYIDMVPPENVLMDPACDWRDPINTSAYVVYLMPMYVVDIEARMSNIDGKTGASEWKQLNRGEILSTSTAAYNTVSQAREGDNRPDKHSTARRDEFAIRWVHANYVRMDGQEYVYYTLGTEHMLTEPVPIEEVHPVGRRPFTYGFSVIEAHKFSPSSPTELISGLQFAVNDVANLRIDNVRLALNKRYFLRRGAAVDLEALMRSVPGGGVYTDNPERDVKVIETRDVTASSYQEQVRLETESNDISGTFLGGSVQNNRALNETVGGMEMLAAGHNALSEFDITTFVYTWVKPQLELLWAFIQSFERDEVISKSAFDSAAKELPDLIPDFEDDESGEQTAAFRNKILSTMLKENLNIKINVGLGATNPQRKMAALNQTVGTMAQNELQASTIDWDEVSKEMFSINGFQDGARFLKQKDEEVKVTEQDVEAAHQQGVEEGSISHHMARIEMEREVKMAAIDADNERHVMTLAAKENITFAQMQNKLDIESQRSKDRRDSDALKNAAKRNELDYKQKTGKPGY